MASLEAELTLGNAPEAVLETPLPLDRPGNPSDGLLPDQNNHLDPDKVATDIKKHNAVVFRYDPGGPPYPIANPACIAAISKSHLGVPLSEREIARAAQKAGLETGRYWRPPHEVVEILKAAQSFGLKPPKPGRTKAVESEGGPEVFSLEHVTITEAAKIAGLSREQLIEELERRSVPYHKLGGRKGLYLKLPELVQAGVITKDRLDLEERSEVITDLSIGRRTLAQLCKKVLHLPKGTPLSPEHIALIREYLAQDEERIKIAVDAKSKRDQAAALGISDSTYSTYCLKLKHFGHQPLEEAELRGLIKAARSI